LALLDAAPAIAGISEHRFLWAVPRRFASRAQADVVYRFDSTAASQFEGMREIRLRQRMLHRQLGEAEEFPAWKGITSARNRFCTRFRAFSWVRNLEI
jgi:hypothetical protein